MGDDFDEGHPSLNIDYDGQEIALETLAKLDANEQARYVEAWFRRYYEDPANEMPHDSAEGGYQYIFGGPYYAREVLEDQFGGTVSEDVIEAVGARLDRFGFEWAPSDNHPNRSHDYEEPEPFDPFIEALEGGAEFQPDEMVSEPRQALLTALAEVKDGLELLGYPGIGHNRPPGALDEEAEETKAEVAKAQESLAAMAGEAARAQPDFLSFARAGEALRAFGRWVAHKADIAAEEFAKEAGKHGFKVLVAAIPTTLEWGNIHRLIEAATNAAVVWLHHCAG